MAKTSNRVHKKDSDNNLIPQEIMDELEPVKDFAQRFVKERPTAAVVGALALGVILGWKLRAF